MRLGRPKFLLGGFALYGLGALAAHASGYGFDLAAYLWGQLAVTFIQSMTHYSNDYFDFEADAANHHPTRWSGGSRVLVRGQLPRWVALMVALLLAMLAAGIIVILALGLGASVPSIAPVILSIMLVLAWSYSSPPLRLHSRGFGEPTVVIIVPLLTPLSGFLIQAGELHPLPLLLCVPLSALLAAMLLTLEFPDAGGDHRVGKRSWVVLIGARRVAHLCGVLTVIGFAASFASVGLGAPEAVAAGWLALVPLGIFQLSRLLVAQDWQNPKTFSRLEFGAVALFFLAVVADLAALWHTLPD